MESQQGLTKAPTPYRLGESLRKEFALLILSIFAFLATIMMVMRLGHLSPIRVLTAVRFEEDR
jgi:hypothetical protein